jgi:dipeptidyl aminopeptidase/acylaminoacyl peptidase
LMHRRQFLITTAGVLSARAAGSGLGTIAYVQEDGLWTRDLPAGAPKQAVEGAKLSAPRFSPSGKWIAYTQSGAVQVVSLREGGPVALGTAPRAQWAPDDELLVEAAGDLKLFSASNGFRQPVRTIRGASLPALFSGPSMVYGSRSTLVWDQSGNGSRVVLSKEGSGLIPAAWAGKIILYWEDLDFSASIMADGLALFRISVGGGSPSPIDLGSLVYEDSVALSPDGNRLAISAGNGRYHWADKRIAIVDLKSGQISYLTGTDIAAVFPAWSPDGAKIAYCAAPSPAGSEQIGGGEPAKRLLAQRRIFVGRRQITSDARYRDEKPLWSADGSHILFTRIDDQSRLTVWLTEVVNPSPTQVAGPLPGSEYAWFGYYGYVDWRALLDWYR